MSEVSDRRSNLFATPICFLVDRIIELEDQSTARGQQPPGQCALCIHTKHLGKCLIATGDGNKVCECEVEPAHPELGNLAHEIAEDDSKSVLDSMLGWTKDGAGGNWLDRRRPAEGCEFYIDRAIKYLEAEGILKRCPEDPQLIGWDEMEEVDG